MQTNFLTRRLCNCYYERTFPCVPLTHASYIILNKPLTNPNIKFPIDGLYRVRIHFHAATFGSSRLLFFPLSSVEAIYSRALGESVWNSRLRRRSTARYTHTREASCHIWVAVITEVKPQVHVAKEMSLILRAGGWRMFEILAIFCLLSPDTASVWQSPSLPPLSLSFWSSTATIYIRGAAGTNWSNMYTRQLPFYWNL